MRCQWDSSGYRAHGDGSLVFWSLFHSCRYPKMSSFHYFFPWFLGVSCLIWTGDEITYQNMLNSSTVFGMGEETGYWKWPTSVCKLHFRVTGVTLVQKRPSHTNWNPKAMKHQSKALAMVQERAPKSLDNPRIILSVRTIWVYWIKHTYPTIFHYIPPSIYYYVSLYPSTSPYIPMAWLVLYHLCLMCNSPMFQKKPTKTQGFCARQKAGLWIFFHGPAPASKENPVRRGERYGDPRGRVKMGEFHIMCWLGCNLGY
jgi:hypothetical protein